MCDQVFAAVAERLSDGRPYLMGESFTAADLTFAALAYPVLHPPQLQYLLPEFDELPSKMKKVRCGFVKCGVWARCSGRVLRSRR